MIFYMLLIPILIGIVYTLSHDQWWAALIFMVLCVLVLYKGLVRLKSSGKLACNARWQSGLLYPREVRS